MKRKFLERWNDKISEVVDFVATTLDDEARDNRSTAMGEFYSWSGDGCVKIEDFNAFPSHQNTQVNLSLFAPWVYPYTIGYGFQDPKVQKYYEKENSKYLDEVESILADEGLTPEDDPDDYWDRWDELYQEFDLNYVDMDLNTIVREYESGNVEIEFELKVLGFTIEESKLEFDIDEINSGKYEKDVKNEIKYLLNLV